MEELGEIFDFFAGEAVDDAGLAFVLPDELDDFLVEVHGVGGFGADLVIEIGAVERRYE